MKADEDEDDETTIASGRYPCLPSLVALQQMRNRLHMAHNGKRLMKWSAMATGRELRKIAQEVDEVFRGFEQDMKDAFILLARCRYYYPNLNVMTTENVGKQAAVTVDYSTKCVTGVRIMQYEIIESGLEPMPCLGIDRGGKCIREAKIAWLELLKRLIMILQLRTSFMLLDMSNKGSTKKANVLGKIVIPKTETTIRYILSQLEEVEREEFFRLKKVLEVKYRHKKKKQQEKKPVCPICKAEEAAAKKKEEMKAKEKCIICKGPMKADPDKAAKEEARRADMKEQLDKIISITNEYDKKGIQSANVNDFKLMAEQLKKKLKSKEFAPIPRDVDVKKLCSACKQRFKMQTPSITFSLDKPEGDAIICKICDSGSEGGGSGALSVGGQRSPVTSLKKPPSEYRAPSPVSLSQSPSKPSPVSLSQPPKIPSAVSPKKPKPKDPAVCERHADLEIGTFETDVKEIVRIVRKRNADGTLTEEKMIITIRKETRNPQGGDEEEITTSSRVEEETSSSSCFKNDNPYDSKRTIGVITIPYTPKRPSVIAREVNSYYSQLSPSSSEPGSLVTIDSELEAWLEATKIFTDASTNEVLPNFDESKTGIAATVNPKLAIIPREVQSYDSPAVSTNNCPVVRNCKSSSSMICINDFIDKIDEENEMEAAKCSTSLNSNTEDENEKTGDPRNESLVTKKGGLKSYNLPLAIAKSMNLDKPCIPTSNKTTIATRTDILTGRLLELKNDFPLFTDKNILSNNFPVTLKEKTIEKEPLTKIQLKIDGTVEEINQETTPILETPTEMNNDIKLGYNKNEIENFNLCKLTTCKHFTERKRNKDSKYLKDKNFTIDESFPEVVEKEIDYLPEYYYDETKEAQFRPFHNNIASKMKSARSDLELGVYETSIQEIAQIVRKRNKDGTLTEERKLVQIKREIKYPAENDQNDDLVETIVEKIYVNSSRASTESKRYIDSQTVGMVSTYDPEKWRTIGREVKSYYAPIDSQKDELPRCCMSSTSMITVDHEFEAVCKCLIDNTDQKENIASDLREYVTSSTEFEKIIDYFVPNEYTEEASTSGNSKKCVCRSTSSSEHHIDLDSIQEQQRSTE